MINTTLLKLSQASTDCLTLADQLHRSALDSYPESEFTRLDSQSLTARNLHVQLQTAAEVRRFEGGVYALTQEYDRLTARVAELESYYLKASEDDFEDLQETIESINSERLRYKKSIHSALNQEFQLNISDESVVALQGLGILV